MRGAPSVAPEHQIAALEQRSRIGQPQPREEIPQVGHRDLLVPSHVDAPEKSDVGLHGRGVRRWKAGVALGRAWTTRTRRPRAPVRPLEGGAIPLAQVRGRLVGRLKKPQQGIVG